VSPITSVMLSRRTDLRRCPGANLDSALPRRFVWVPCERVLYLSPRGNPWLWILGGGGICFWMDPGCSWTFGRPRSAHSP